jgi:hypothetical protein
MIYYGNILSPGILSLKNKTNKTNEKKNKKNTKKQKKKQKKNKHIDKTSGSIK